jgi:plastocyanin
MLSVTGTGSTVTLTGLAPGSATVTATSETKTATTAAITITNTTQTFPTTATVTIADNSFTPNRVDIQTNGTVTWNWTGATAHNVTFGTGPSTVTSISQKSTGTDSRTFPSVGTYNYECTLHPGMTATVVTHAP